MAEFFKCEVCGKKGIRRRMAFVPAGWFYAEVLDDETKEVIVVGVCSVGCGLDFWKKGPGRMTVEGKEPEPKATE